VLLSAHFQWVEFECELFYTRLVKALASSNSSSTTADMEVPEETLEQLQTVKV
jgi:hypothetical protein